MLKFAVFFVSAFILSSTAMAAASDSPLDLGKPILDAIMSGEYVWAAVAGVVFLVALVRKFGPKLWAPLGSGKSAAIMVVLGSLFGGLLNSLSAGEPFSLEMVTAALKIAIFSGGAVALAKELAPSWLRPILDAIIGSDSAQKAKDAGDAAVKANPAKGPGIEFKDVE